MSGLPLIFSLIYFIGSTIYAFFAVYIYSIDPKAKLNHLFAMLCFTLFLWSFSFSMMASSHNQQEALFWARTAAIGWGTMYSFYLHFTIVLTKKDKLLIKSFSLFLIYLPALVNIYFFVLSKDSSRKFHMMESPFGWMDHSVTTSINSSFSLIFFDSYYISFTIFCLILLTHFGISSRSKIEKKQIAMLSGSFLLLLILGTLVDRVAILHSIMHFPKLSIIFILIPISVIFYIIKKYDFMRSPKVFHSDMNEILSEQKTEEFYLFMVYAFILSGFIVFTFQYFLSNVSFRVSSVAALIPIALGFTIYLIKALMADRLKKDIYITIIICISIPIMFSRFLIRGATTIWIFPIIFLLIAIILNRKFMIIAVAAASIFAQLLVVFLSPITMVRMSSLDYILRIFLFAMIVYLVFYVNKIYMEKLRDNESQILLQKMIADISSAFINITSLSLDKKINFMLDQAGRYCNCERAYIFFFSNDYKYINFSYEWYTSGVAPLKEITHRISCESMPWWISQIINNNMIVINDIQAMPAEASYEKQLFCDNNIQSLLSIPIKNKDGVLGFLGFESERKKVFWNQSHRELLSVLSNLLSDALMKIHTEDHINYMAYYDALTALPNRTFFHQQFTKYIAMAGDKNELLGIMFLDIDAFQYVNDTIGHEGGDELLKSLAKKISHITVGHGLVSRFGGDEFAILFYDLKEVDAIQSLAENVMKIFKKPLFVKEREFFITASAGISIYPMDGAEADTLIRNANITMYESKLMGKNQYNFCSTHMRETLAEKIKLTNYLHRALEKNEFVLYYQPQVSTNQNNIIGFEALLRWLHPKKGMLAPGLFLHLAEQTGLIKSLGEWVIDTACCQMKEWTNRFPLESTHMAVNLSVRQFKDPHLVEFIQSTLTKYDLDSSYLEMEITESEDIEGEKGISNIFHALKKLGITISIDDFGTKYSSLSRLKRLPVDRLKIDMQFIHGISSQEKDRGITKSIIDLGKNLGVKVIAEGVETEDQFNFLLKHACDEIQGFYFYRPMPAEDISTLLQKMFNIFPEID